MSPNVHHAPENDDLIFAQADEEIQFAEEIETSRPEQSWKILIVDDETEVHEVTKLVLSDVTFENRSLSFMSAYSAEEAKQILRSHSDIAIIFLDVVMETEDAGLQLVNYVREELGNRPARIILRTGQPGQAPETDVALNYGIDDYKLKTELTSEKLLLVVVTALRAFSTFMQMLEVSQKLRSQLSDYQQAETDLRSGSPTDALLQSSPHREKIETLGQLVTEVTNDILNHSNAATFSMLSTMNQIARLVLRLTDEQSAKLGLSQTKLSVLMYLNESPEFCASPSALAKHCGVSRAAMTGLLDGLEQEAYVERDHDPADRRALKVRLTPKGQEFLGWIAPQGQYQFSELIETLDDTERQKMIQFAQKCLMVLSDRSTN
ncbi:response regulator receiver sensor signal transduction histidine kinase [Leptolyngbya sp. NIES-3755]|nr:response regulator receiver sensor signal transduction histidine kinase [Leptolyngbya sp. NIES-3755]